jgi:hypothetical protein
MSQRIRHASPASEVRSVTSVVFSGPLLMIVVVPLSKPGWNPPPPLGMPRYSPEPWLPEVGLKPTQSLPSLSRMLENAPACF